MASTKSDWIKNHPLAAYFGLAYAITWAVALSIAASVRGWIALQIPPSAHFLTSYGPMLSAFIVTAIVGGAAGVRELVGRMVRWRVGGRWVLVAIASPIAFYVVAGFVMRVVQGSWPDWSRFGGTVEIAGLRGLAGWGFHVLTFGFGEETGWRGFALPRLQKGRSARSATLLLWVFWVLWHLPMFAYKENYLAMGIFDLVGWVVGILSGAIVLTWLYNSTGGSVLMVALWHGTYNAAVSATEPLIAASVSAFVILWAVVIARVAGPENLSGSGKHTIGVPSAGGLHDGRSSQNHHAYHTS